MGPEPMAGTAWKKGGKTGKNGVRIGGRPREITAQKNSGGKTGSEQGLESKMGEIGTKKGEISPKKEGSNLEKLKNIPKNREITPKKLEIAP